jgi:hypothetical protein
VPCFYCGVKLTKTGKHHKTKDHIVPKAKGGTKVVPACFLCNHYKADLSLESFRNKYFQGREFYFERIEREQNELTSTLESFTQEFYPNFDSQAFMKDFIIPDFVKRGLVPNLDGVRFGSFTVIKNVGKRGTQNSKWLCKCDCGLEEYKSHRAIRNPKNQNDACVECRRRIYKKKHKTPNLA